MVVACHHDYFSRCEKRGLCYSIFSFAALHSDGGTFAVYAGTSASQVDEMLSVCAGELATLASGVKDDEARAKAQIRANLLMSRESVSSCADALASDYLIWTSLSQMPKFSMRLMRLMVQK